VKPRHAALGVALAVAAGLVLFGDRPPAHVVEPAGRPVATPVATRGLALKPGQGNTVQILRLQPRAALIGELADAGAGDAFATRSWTPPPPPPQPEPPPPAPVAPALPFTFIGKSLEEGTWEVYLAKGERAYVVHDHDVVDGSYRVESIKPPLMTLTYLPLGQVQQLNIGVFD
jgi:hypothetical protein